jgi:AraC-like DNA-binding protein
LQHIEFFHIEHFENNYHRIPPPGSLKDFIDFFWETKFDPLWSQYPKGFSDAQFPNIGYTYIINLGTPFVMQVDDKKFPVKTDCFLPRYNAIECFHRPGNHLFGIKFRISPVILEKKINFSEYKEYVFPLSYLLDQAIIDKVKKAGTFKERTVILSNYFLSLLAKYDGPLQPVNRVSKILDRCYRQNDFGISLETLAVKHKLSLRTLQRHFENCTGISTKKALQVMRIRKATAHLVNSPQDFHYSLYGYYDHSHFYKHLKKFLQKNTLKNMEPHLKLLERLYK